MKAVVVLIFLFIIGGFSAVGQFVEIFYSVAKMGIITILSFMNFLPTSIFDFLERIISDQWSMTGVTWIDLTLFNIASFLPSVATYLISKLGFKLDWRISGFLSLLIIVLVLNLFSSLIFWMIILLLFLCFVVMLMITHKSNQKNIEFNDIKEEISANQETKEQLREEIDLKVSIDKCPWCNSYLVKRKGPHGYFKGCRSYPVCRYTEKL